MNVAQQSNLTYIQDNQKINSMNYPRTTLDVNNKHPYEIEKSSFDH